jgi:hypothetical protein
MKDEINISAHFPETKKEDLKAAAKRRENYALVRDLQAQETNESIKRRLVKDKESQE